MSDADYRFEVAISFAGDSKRDLVRSIAHILEERLGKGKVFFDEWFESEIAGPDAQVVLQKYYRKLSRLVVTCVCAHYNEKPWTQEEWRAIQAFERDLRDAGTDNRKRMRFLPLRFGEGEVDGLFSTAIVPDVRRRSPEEIALLILKRLELAKLGNGKVQTLRDRHAPWCPELVVIPPGRFLMGWPTDGKDRQDDEGPQHEVKIAYSLAVGQYPVTFAEWDAFMVARGIDSRRPKDWNWGRGRRPVIDVSWDQAQTYLTWLSAQTEKHYRLLSEAEWEYACRAGTTTRYSCGDEITEYKANFRCKHGRTTEVGVYPANAFGLHDMHGNVNEWVEDGWHDNYYDAPDDGTAWPGGNFPRRVMRGGSWFDHPLWLRSAARYGLSPSHANNKLGFRVCREA